MVPGVNSGWNLLKSFYIFNLLTNLCSHQSCIYAKLLCWLCSWIFISMYSPWHLSNQMAKAAYATQRRVPINQISCVEDGNKTLFLDLRLLDILSHFLALIIYKYCSLNIIQNIAKLMLLPFLNTNSSGVAKIYFQGGVGGDPGGGGADLLQH